MARAGLRTLALAVVMAVALVGALAPLARPVHAVGAGFLWIGNNHFLGDVHKTDTTGAVVGTVPSTPVTGIAWDGTSLYFTDGLGNMTRRTPDGATVLQSFAVPPPSGNVPTLDLAWDTKRSRLWRIDHSPPRLVKINPVTELAEATYVIPSFDPVLDPRGGLGIAYDTKRDVLYASFCKAGCGNLNNGLVLIIDPDTGAVNGELFRTAGFATAGLAYDRATDTLWVGDLEVVRNMTLGGAVLSSFPRPGATRLVDGLEFIDSTPPACKLTAVIQGPPKQLQITAQDTGSGIKFIQVLQSTNAITSVPAFPVGTDSPVVVTATKLNQSLSSTVRLRVTDVDGNATECDPVFTLVVRERGKPVSQTFTGIPQAESLVTVNNGTPGVTNLSVKVNGKNFQVAGLKDGESRTISVASAMQPGDTNTFVLEARGKPGGSVDVVIHD